MIQLVQKFAQHHDENSLFCLVSFGKSAQTRYFFSKDTTFDSLSSIISDAGLNQLKVAESEKGPHVTYFFNGGHNVVHKGEYHIIIPSNTNTHDHAPEMKAEHISSEIQKFVEKQDISFILVNFANPDMVGHTGVWDAVIKGVEEVDLRLQELVTFLSKNNYTCCITADHGNADTMFDIETHEPHTAHTLNPVPFIVYSKDEKLINLIRLSQNPHNSLVDIAGTILDLMHIPYSAERFSSLLDAPLSHA